MVRVGKETKQSLEDVLAKATAFFGPDGVGLAIQQRSDSSVAFEGGGGYVTVSANTTGEGNRTEVEVVSKEWDRQAQQFLEKI